AALAADLILQCFGHLAAGAVMNADEQDVLLCHIAFGHERTCERRSWARNNFPESPPAFLGRARKPCPIARNPAGTSDSSPTQARASAAANTPSSFDPAPLSPSP